MIKLRKQINQLEAAPMLKLNDFILLKATFNMELSDAVLNKDQEAIEELLNAEYAYEIENGFVKMEVIDVDRLYKVHLEEINDEEAMKEML